MLYKWLMLSSFFSVCSEAIFFDVGFDLKISYIIMVLNFPLLFYLRGKLNNSFFITVIVLFFFSFGGSYGVTNSTIFQLIGILLSLTYYYSFISVLIKKHTLDEVFCFFSKFFHIVNVIFLIFYFVGFFTGYNGRDFRYHSIFMEPAHFCAVAIPVVSFFYYRYTKLHNKYDLFGFLMTIFSVLLSMSSIGYIGILLLLMSNMKFSFFRTICFLVISISFLFALYLYVPMFALRINDSAGALTSMNVNNVNYSTFALISNLYVTINSLEQNLLFGSGLGNHELSYFRYIYNLTGIEMFVSADSIGLNAKDANSLLLRILSETGVVGFLLIFYQLFIHRPKIKTEILIRHPILDANSLLLAIKNGCFIYILLKFFREGHWFSPEMYFIVFMYQFSKTILLKSKEV